MGKLNIKFKKNWCKNEDIHKTIIIHFAFLLNAHVYEYDGFYLFLSS